MDTKVCIFSGTKINFSGIKNNFSATKNNTSGTKINFSATKINFSRTKINFSATTIILVLLKIQTFEPNGTPYQSPYIARLTWINIIVSGICHHI